MYLMHSNVSLKYPSGTSTYLNCVLLLSDPCEANCGGASKEPKIVHFYPKKGHRPRTGITIRRSESGRSESGSEGVGDQLEGLKGQQED